MSEGPAVPAGAARACVPADRRAGRGGARPRRSRARPAAAERARAGEPVRGQPVDRARGAAGAGEQRRGPVAARRPERARGAALLLRRPAQADGPAGPGRRGEPERAGRGSG